MGKGWADAGLMGQVSRVFCDPNTYIPRVTKASRFFKVDTASVSRVFCDPNTYIPRVTKASRIFKVDTASWVPCGSGNT